MSYGVSIKNSDGKYFLTPDMTPLNFIKKITINVAKGRNLYYRVDTSIPENCAMMPFFRIHEDITYRGDDLRTRLQIIKRGIVDGFHELSVQASGDACTVTIYLFSNFVIQKDNKYGMTVYNELGVEVYNNLCQPLELSSIKRPDLNLFGYPGAPQLRSHILIDIGYPIASICTTYGLKSFPVGGQNGWLTYTINSGAMANQLGLFLSPGESRKHIYNYPNIGDIYYIDTRKYE